MSTRRVVHLLRWFVVDGEQLAGEEVLARVPPGLLRQLCERPADDLLLGTYPVGPREVTLLAPLVDHAFDRDRYFYVIEPAQVESWA